MAARLQQLNTARGGINRLRTKGGPSKEILYDLLNGYVDASGAAVSRPGTVQDYTLTPGTKGLCSFDGALVVFSHQVTGGMPAGVTCEVLTHPTNPALALLDIHFASPFLGALYVVAEFADGSVFHYWLESANPWLASTSYLVGEAVTPTAPNGLVYRASRAGEPGPAWAPDVRRAAGDVIEPTVYNGYRYTVIDVQGANPRSGAVEPAWPAQDGATINENTEGSPVTPATGGTAPPASTVLPPSIVDRYGNPGGSTPDGTITQAER